MPVQQIWGEIGSMLLPSMSYLGTRDTLLALGIQNIWLIIAHYDMDIEGRHIVRKQNIIDTFSHIGSNKLVNQVMLECLDNFI